LQPGGFPVQGVIEDGSFEVSLSIDEITLKDLFPGLDKTFAVTLKGQVVRGIDNAGDGYLLLQEGEVGDGHVSAVMHDGTVALCRVYQDHDGLRLQHTDGTETRLDPEHDDFKLLGRYAGHISQKGLFRAFNSMYTEHALNGETVTTT